MTGPPDGKVPTPGGRRRDSCHHHHQGDLEDLALQHKASVQAVTDIPGWESFARWLGAVVTS
jgi:hypothetical protein